MDQEFFFASAITAEPLLQDALHRLETRLGPQINGKQVDLAVVFYSSFYRGMAQQIQEGLQALFHPGQIIGCSAESVIGAQEELEQTPAISLLAAHLPEAVISPFFLSPTNWNRLLDDEITFREAIGAPENTHLFLLFADPFSTPVDHVLEAFNVYFPGIPIMGGMASAAMVPGQNSLLLNERISSSGAVGLALAGEFDIDLVVSQGCRPIGDPYVVTQTEKNVILSLENQPALFRIQEMVDTLPEEDERLLQRGLLIGRAIHPSQEILGRGDFLVRGVLAANRQNGAITVADNIQTGEIIQFHVRDALTAKEDLEMMLIPQAFRPPASGALLFTCNGRGMRLFDHPNGDISITQKNLGNIPIAGFFCAGEIGPVGRQNFIHGHTACLAIFRPVQRPA
jgi:small ligand-binding sensory domain FIST